MLDQPALEAWGRRIGREAARPLFLALRGDLGAGKSVLARAIARGAGVTGPLPSPTFNLLYRYDAERGRIVHIDLYRITAPEDVWELGWQELGGPDDVVLVEWPERAGPLLPEPRWDIVLEEDVPGSHLRRVRMEPHGRPPDLPGPP